MDINDISNNITHPHVKEYLFEAVKSYNSGSFRACITYTWLSVFMDISQKIEQLANLDDSEAKVICTKLDKIRKENNIKEMQSHERDILTTARKFELFDDITFIDLERIQKDRHRCVHPLLYEDGTLYSPTAEQARAHLLNAYRMLLKERNVFGKSVFKKLLETINLPNFPKDYDGCKTVLEESYIKSPRDSLLNSFTTVILKEYLWDNIDKKKRGVYENIFRYLLETKRGKIEEILKQQLPAIIKNTNNSDMLINFLTLVILDVVFYDTLTDGDLVFIKNGIKELPSGNIKLLNKLADISKIKDVVEERIGKTTRLELQRTPLDDISNVTKGQIIKLFLESESFDQANSFATVVSSVIPQFDNDEINALVEGFERNNQITDSWAFESVLRELRSENKITAEKYNELLDKYKKR